MNGKLNIWLGLRLVIAAACIMISERPAPAEQVTLADSSLQVSFDSESGALTRMEDKGSNWTIERRPELGASFRLYAPLPNRRYNPVFGGKQRAAEVKRISANQIEVRWTNLVSENGGVLPIGLTSHVTLTNSVLTFAAILENNSALSVETIEYPCLGDLSPPTRGSSLAAWTTKEGKLQADELYPHFHNEKGYWGVTYPTKMLEPQGRSFCLVQSASEGLYAGLADRPDYQVQYVFEQHPGVISGITALVPPEDEISGWTVHLDFRVCHFVFMPPHSTKQLAPVVLDCYKGEWHPSPL